jgi:hypothetical protein
MDARYCACAGMAKQASSNSAANQPAILESIESPALRTRLTKCLKSISFMVVSFWVNCGDLSGSLVLLQLATARTILRLARSNPQRCTGATGENSLLTSRLDRGTYSPRTK